MFQRASSIIHESCYGIWARTRIPIKTRSGGRTNTRSSTGSGFMVSSGYIITTSHVLHDKARNGVLHTEFLVIRSPDIGQKSENATLVAEDTVRDLAILQVENSRSTVSLSLNENLISTGTTIGSLGFPLSKVRVVNNRLRYGLQERFQGGHISRVYQTTHGDRSVDWYEIDKAMYPGSSGCPGFTPDGVVVGVQKGVKTKGDADVPFEERQELDISVWVSSTSVLEFACEQGIM